MMLFRCALFLCILPLLTSSGLRIHPATDIDPVILDLPSPSVLDLFHSEHEEIRRVAEDFDSDSTSLRKYLEHVALTASVLQSSSSSSLHHFFNTPDIRRSHSSTLSPEDQALFDSIRASLSDSPPLFHPYRSQSEALFASQSDPFGWDPISTQQTPFIHAKTDHEHRIRRVASQGIRVRRSVDLSEEITGAVTKIDYDVTIGPGFFDLEIVEDVHVYLCSSDSIEVLYGKKGGEEAVRKWVPGSILHVKMPRGKFCQTNGAQDDGATFDEIYVMVYRRELIGRNGDEGTFLRLTTRQVGLHELFLDDNSYVNFEFFGGNVSALPTPRHTEVARRFSIQKLVRILGFEYNYDSETNSAADNIELFHKEIEHHRDWTKGGSYSKTVLKGEVQVDCSDCYLFFEAKAGFVIEGGVWDGVSTLDAYLSGTVKSSLGITVDAEATIDIDTNLEFVRPRKVAKISFTVYAVPVWFDVKFGLSFASQIHFEGAFHASYTVSYLADAKVGYSLDDGFYRTFEQTPSFPKPALSTIVQQAQIKMTGPAQLLPEFQLVFYSTVPIFARVIPYLTLEARLDLTQMKVFVEDFFWGLDLEIGISELEIAGYDVWDEHSKTFELYSQDICPGCLKGKDRSKPFSEQEVENYWFMNEDSGSSANSETDVFGAQGPDFGAVDPMWTTQVPREMPIMARTVQTAIFNESQLYVTTGSIFATQGIFPSHGYYLCIFARRPTDALKVFIRPQIWTSSFGEWDVNDFPFVGKHCWTLDYSSYDSQMEYMLMETNQNEVIHYHEVYPLVFIRSSMLSEYLPYVVLQKAESIAFLYRDVPTYSGGIVLTSYQYCTLNFKVIVTGKNSNGEEIRSATSVYPREDTTDCTSPHVKEIDLSLPVGDSIATYDVFILVNSQLDSSNFRLALSGYGMISGSGLLEIDRTRLWKFQSLLTKYKFAVSIAPPLPNMAIRLFSKTLTSPKGGAAPSGLQDIVGNKVVVDPFEDFLTHANDFLMMQVPSYMDITSLSIRILYQLLSGEQQTFSTSGGSKDFVFTHFNIGMSALIAKVVLDPLECPFVFSAMSTGTGPGEDWTPISPTHSYFAADGVTSYFLFDEIELSEEETFFSISFDLGCSVPTGVMSVHMLFDLETIGTTQSVWSREGELVYFSVTQLENAYLRLDAKYGSGIPLKFRRFDPTQTMWDFPAIDDYRAHESTTHGIVGVDGIFGDNHEFVVIGVQTFSYQEVTAKVLAYEEPEVVVEFHSLGPGGGSYDPVFDGFDVNVTIVNCPPVQFSSMFFDRLDPRVRKILSSFVGGNIWAKFFLNLDRLIEENSWKRQTKAMRDLIHFDVDNPCSVVFRFEGISLVDDDYNDDSVSLSSVPADVFAFQDGRQVDPTTLPPVHVRGTQFWLPAPVPIEPPCPGDCSGHGSCQGDPGDQFCVCDDGYVGPNCLRLLCSDKNSLDANCWGKGDCVMSDVTHQPTCQCDSEFYGEFCDVPRCNGQTGDDRCHFQGTCLPNHACECNLAFEGPDCTSPICNYGTAILYHNDGENRDGCANNGTCRLLDSKTGEMKCDCLPGYQGPDCGEAICFGKEASADDVCTGHGACVSAGKCLCSDGYAGDACDMYDCDGVDCFGHGTCSGRFDQTTCLCQDGYDPASNCEDPICFTKSGNSSCSDDHGICVSPDHCDCAAAWGGNECDEVMCFSKHGTSACGGPTHGSCVALNNCRCLPGWKETECDVPDCECDHGTCSSPTECVCTDPDFWYGPKCDLQVCDEETYPCQNGGTCDEGHCTCPTGFYGSLCHNPTCYGKSGSARCSGHGYCQRSHNCVCNPQYHGTECDIWCFDGIYDDTKDPPQCYCGEDHYGPTCSEPRCWDQTGEDRCSGIGTCVSVNHCVCPAGWMDMECRTPACGEDWGRFGCVPGKGNCVGHFCECDGDFYGLDCNLEKCNGETMYGEDCKNGGICLTDSGECLCRENYGGPDCSELMCPNDGCRHNGKCVADHENHGVKCDCSGTNWWGNSCELPLCNGKESCQNGGMCRSDHTCQCDEQLWSGRDCEIPVCPGGCNSPHGVCSANHTCICDKGYVQPSCSAKGGSHSSTHTPSNTAMVAAIIVICVVCVVGIVAVAILMFVVGCCVGKRPTMRKAGSSLVINEDGGDYRRISFSDQVDLEKERDSRTQPLLERDPAEEEED